MNFNPVISETFFDATSFTGIILQFIQKELSMRSFFRATAIFQENSDSLLSKQVNEIYKTNIFVHSYIRKCADIIRNS